MKVVFVAICVLLLLVPGARAETGDETNAFVAVAKTTIWGFLLGVVVGGALEIGASDEGSDGDAFRFSVVAGTFAGMGYGIYHVITRDKNRDTGLLNVGEDGVSLARPALQMKREDKTWGADVTVFSWSF
jgi:hypothetical protein